MAPRTFVDALISEIGKFESKFSLVSLAFPDDKTIAYTIWVDHKRWV